METLGFKVVIFVLCVIGHTAIYNPKSKNRQYFSIWLKFFGACCGAVAILIALLLYKDGGCWAIILAVICWGLLRKSLTKFIK